MVCDNEFVIPSRLDNLFTETAKQYYVQDVLTKQSVMVEVMKLKNYLYDDPEGFIFNNFDTYCNLIKLFAEFDASLKTTAFRVLLQAAGKMVNFQSSILEEDVEEFDQQTSFKNRNNLKMAVYLLCQFSHACEEEILRKSASDKITKGRKKKTPVDDSDSFDWSEERLKFLVVLKKIFQKPVRKFWSPPIIEYDFITFVTNSFFKLFENADISKDKVVKTEIFRFLGTVLKETQTGLGYSFKILQVVQDHEHLQIVMADAVLYFMQENGADTLVSDICREATLLDVKTLVKNLTAAHSLSGFLIAVCERCPEKVLSVIGSLLQFLELESHVLRNCCLAIIGVIISKILSEENLSGRDLQNRKKLLSHLEDHVLDVNSFVRCKAIQVVKMLMDDRSLASVELCQFGVLISKRIKDKASNVRKNAMSFMSSFIGVNQFACQAPLAVIKESYEKEYEKLKQMKKSRPFIFDDLEEEEPSGESNTGDAVIFNDSDDGLQGENTNSKEVPDAANVKDPGTQEKEMEVVETESAETAVSDEDLIKQQDLVNYLKNVLNFAEVIHGVVKPVSVLLHSPTQTDVLEAIEFLTAVANSSIPGSDEVTREVLSLVWSNETALKQAVYNSFKTLYLSSVQNKNDVAKIARSLLALLRGSSREDALNLQSFVQHFSKNAEIPESISSILWSNLINPASNVIEEDKVSILLLLGMMAEECPGFVLSHMDEIVNYGLGAESENNFQIAMYTFQVLQKPNAKHRGKVDATRQSETENRLPMNHLLAHRMKYLLVDGILDFSDDQWTPMANEAVSTIFCLMQNPLDLCVKIGSNVTKVVYGGIMSDEEKETSHIPNILLSRFMAFCGHVAVHYLTHLKVDYFASLRLEELLREQRRRKSLTRNMSFATPSHRGKRNSPKSLTKSGKKLQSIQKSYKLMPPMDEETMQGQILEICDQEATEANKLISCLLHLVVSVCESSLMNFNAEVQATASLALTKFMLFSERICKDKMQLFATITEKSPATYIRANMVMAMADLTTVYPNSVEPWTPYVYQRLSDPEVVVREAAIITLTHLILHDYVRVKSLVSEAAKCIADSMKSVSDVAKYLFTELSKKGNVIYNIIPDVISTLSDPKSGFSEENFQTVLRHMLQYIEKEKLIEGLVQKLCYRFTTMSTDIQLHEVTFCLSILTLNDKCFSKLLEFKTLLKERMSDPVILKYITNITANAKKNNAKTAAELEAFRKELGI